MESAPKVQFLKTLSLRSTLKYVTALPILSTWVSATFLGFAWTVLWLFVFFSATLLLDVTTPVDAFLLTFWLTVLVEAILRAVENMDTLVKLANPKDSNAKGDDRYKFGHAVFVVIFGIALLAIYAALTYLVHDVFALDRTLEFRGQDGEHTRDGLFKMIENNWRILNITGVFVPLFVGTFFRIIIYRKRSP